MYVTPLFAAIFGLMYIALSVNVVRLRFKKQVSLGTGDIGALEKEIRIHANFAEYVPFTLLLLILHEILTLSSSLVFWLGCLLLISRVCHVIGMKNGKDYFIYRKLGMIGTLTVILLASLSTLWVYLPLNI